MGSNQIAILKIVNGGNWFHAKTPQQYESCMRLHDRRLLGRDPNSRFRFTSTVQGEALIAQRAAA